jgi:hypothetical protein
MRSRLAVGHGRLSNEPLAGAGIEYPLEVIARVIPGLVPLSPLITAWTSQHLTIGGSTAPFRAQTMGRFAQRSLRRFDGTMGTKPRETVYRSSMRASAERAKGSTRRS